MDQDKLIRKLYDWSLKCLEIRARSVHEIRDYLKLKLQRNVKRGFIEEPSDVESATEQVVNKLKSLKLLDDEEFARLWVESRGQSRSKRVLAGELFKKGIAKELVAATLEGTCKDPGDLIEKLARKAWPKYQKLDRREAKQKLYGFLTRRGFEFEDVRGIVDRVCAVS